MIPPQRDMLVSALRGVLGPAGPLSLHEPDFSGQEWEYVKDCLDKGWVSSVGRYGQQFEEELAKRTGVKYALATVNGTAALHLALIVAGVKPQDEILMPALTFVATANSVAYCNAIPHFVDCSTDTLGVDPKKLDSYLQELAHHDEDGCRNRITGRRIKAIIPGHLFGHPMDIDGLLNVTERYGIAVIEDASESLGSTYRGRATGGFGDFGVLSFNGNKIITTGGGGALLTNNSEWAAQARHLATTAKQSHPWAFYHDTVGFNYRLPSINAALGCAQLEWLDEFVTSKRRLASAYRSALSDVPNILFVTEPQDARSNYWLNAIILTEGSVEERDELLEHLHEEGLMCRPAFTPMHHLPMYENCPRMDLSTTEALYARLINLPSSAFLAKNPEKHASS